MYNIYRALNEKRKKDLGDRYGSCRIIEKAGYTREGLIRQGKMVNTWCDYYIYGILASDLDRHLLLPVVVLQ